MEDNFKIIEGEDVLFVKKTNLVRNYNSETEGFKGKTYRIYAFGTKGFAVHQDDDFHADLQKGDVKKIMLVDTAEGYSLGNYITWTKATAQKNNQAKFDSITADNFKPEVVSHSDLIG